MDSNSDIGLKKEMADYTKIGGWLLLLAFFCIFIFLGFLLPLILSLITVLPNLAIFTLKYKPGYELFPLYYIVTIILNLFGVGLYIFTTVKLLERKKEVKILIPLLLVVSAINEITSAIISNQIPAFKSQDIVFIIFARFIYIVIWTAYIIRSIRVKNTLIN